MKCAHFALLAMLSSLCVSVTQEKQQEQAGTAPRTDNAEIETSTRDLDTAIKVQVNLVQVRVVVKDSAGNTVPDLKQQDFQVFDNGKQQKISAFNVEMAETREAAVATAQEEKVTDTAAEKPAEAGASAGMVNASLLPKRFVALVFDDLHLKVAEAMAVHAATEKLFASLTPTDRVAIYSTEGDVQQDFTGDPAVLRKTLAAIVPHPSRNEGHHECPDISYFQADLIENQHDTQAIDVAQGDAMMNCLPSGRRLAAADIEAIARRILQEGDSQTQQTYGYLSDIVRKLAGMPGQRVLVYVSPGFVVGPAVSGNSWDWIEKAVRAGVVVNTIDAKGLYTPEGLGDIDAPPQVAPDKSVPDTGLDYQTFEGQYRMQTQFESGQVLAGMASNTGGTYFHNRNDLATGLNQALAVPAVSYLLGFRPQEATADGKFHKLKVEVAGKKYQIQARNGYFARKKLEDPEEEAKQEVRETLFSQEEIASVPVQLKTEFYKIDAASAQLTVLTHLDVSGIRFRKADGRSCDDVVFATGVFDSNGQFVSGKMKEISLKLTDSTLQKMGQTGITVKTVFTVKPGTYLVRSVVRGSEGTQLTSRNLSTVIPW